MMRHLGAEPDQEKRIEMMRAEIKKLGGALSDNRDMPADLEEEFLRHVLEFETAESTTLLQLLENAGLEMPSPDEVDDGQLHAKLWEIINRMASLGAYLQSTNHLSDRELYKHLYSESLREQATLFPENPGFAYMIDLIGSGSEEDISLWMKYYAGEATRQQWLRDFPDYEMPPHEEPPYDRDRRLPQSPLG